MNKEQFQQRVFKNGKPLDLELFSWNEEKNVFITKESNLEIDFTYAVYNCIFITGDNCTFKTGSVHRFITGDNCTFITNHGCIFDTGSGCDFSTGDGCTFDTGSNCTFKTGVRCVIVSRSSFKVIEPKPGEIIKTGVLGTIGYETIKTNVNK